MQRDSSCIFGDPSPSHQTILNRFVRQVAQDDVLLYVILRAKPEESSRSVLSFWRQSPKNSLAPCTSFWRSKATEESTSGFCIVLRGRRSLWWQSDANQPHAPFSNNLLDSAFQAGKLAALKQYPPLLSASSAIIVHYAIAAFFVILKIPSQILVVSLRMTCLFLVILRERSDRRISPDFRGDFASEPRFIRLPDA